MTSIRKSHMNTLFKTLGRTYNTFKMLIGNMLWEVLVILRIDRLVTPLIKNIFLILMITVKYLWKFVSLVNIIIIIWLFYFNTPVITGKLILGWLGDFFRVAWVSYTDTVAKFFDYFNRIIESGFNSVPKRPSKPVEYPDYGFIREFREVFRKLRELPPSIEDSTPRWYDSLRDKYVDNRPNYNIFLDNKFNNTPDNNTSFISNAYQFMKDYWHIGAIVGSVIVVGGGIFIFWDPITTTMSSIGSTVKDGFNSIIQYFSGRGPGSGGAPDNSDTASIVIRDSDYDTPTAQEILDRFPNVPTSIPGSESVTRSASPMSIP